MSPLVYLLMLAHICVDMIQGGIAAVIPFLVLQNGFSYAAATMLVLAANIASAVIQPLFGWIGDRVARPWLLSLGVLLAGVGMAGIGVFQAYWLVVASALVSGVGNAMVHPEGGRIAFLAGGRRKEKSMSLFSLGGQIGFCVGPVVATAAVSAFGLRGMLSFLLACLPVSALLAAANRRLLAFGLREKGATGIDERDRWGMFSLVLGACSARSVVFYGVTSFVPLLIVANFGQTEQFASSVITVFAAVGALATFASGYASRIVRTPHLTVACYVGLVAAVFAFDQSRSLALSLAMVGAIACFLNLFNPPCIALGQGYLPQHLGMASGLTFGVAVAVGGVASPLLGLMGDAVGLRPVMWALLGVAVFGLCVSVALAALDGGGRGIGRWRAK